MASQAAHPARCRLVQRASPSVREFWFRMGSTRTLLATSRRRRWRPTVLEGTDGMWIPRGAHNLPEVILVEKRRLSPRGSGAGVAVGGALPADGAPDNGQALHEPRK